MVEEVLAYLTALLGGGGIAIEPLRDSERLRAGWLVNFYMLRVLTVREQRCVLAFAKPNVRYTPAALAKQFAMGREGLGMPWIYVPRELGAHDVSRLIAAHVPYVFPKRSFYLPDLGVAVTSPPKGGVCREQFSVAAQLLLIGYILRKWDGIMTLAEGIKRVGFSMASLVHAFREIEHFGAGERTTGSDRTVTLTLQPARIVWERCRERFFNPCKRVVGVAVPPEASVPAGADALAAISDLNEAAPTEFALPLKGFAVRDPEVLSPETAPYRLQLWHYPPAFFDGKGIDPVSLLLSLRHVADDRVQIEVEKLEERFKWSMD